MPEWPNPVEMMDFTDLTIFSGSYPFWTEFAGELGPVNFGSAAWPAANRVIYVPFTLDQPAQLQKMFVQHGAVAGTFDVGIVDANSLVRLCSVGATTSVVGVQIVTPTGTLLIPAGHYYAAMTVSTVTTETVVSAAVPIPNLSMVGVCQDANASSTIPTAPSLTRCTAAYLPDIGVSFTGVQ